MTRALTGAKRWAREEFSRTQLGDLRRSRRVVRLAQALAANEGGALPGAVPDWAQLKAAYRVVSRPEVSYEKLTCAHRDATRRRCNEAGVFLMIEDTTDLDFTGRQVGEKMGWSGDGGGRGIYLHTTLAARVCGWERQQEPAVEVVGLLGQRWWARRHEPRRGRESRAERLRRKRESERWAGLFPQPQPSGQAQWIYVADRESDVYEVPLRCRSAGVDFVVRANQNRALEGQEAHIFESVAEGKVLGEFTKKLRARPGVPAREVSLQVRARQLTLRAPYRPGQKLEPVRLTVVDVRQRPAPAAGRALHWVLLSSLPCGTLRQARRVVWAYQQRWLIEQYHKALKTGTRMEQTQLGTPERVTALLGINAVVAVRLLQMKLLGRARPSGPVKEGSIGAEVLLILEAQYGAPRRWTNRELLVRIARLGGFPARKGDGLPGWLTLWRGWRRLMTMVQGFNLAGGRDKCG